MKFCFFAATAVLGAMLVTPERVSA